jgi:hypothetical protein
METDGATWTKKINKLQQLQTSLSQIMSSFPSKTSNSAWAAIPNFEKFKTFNFCYKISEKHLITYRIMLLCATKNDKCQDWFFCNV